MLKTTQNIKKIKKNPKKKGQFFCENLAKITLVAVEENAISQPEPFTEFLALFYYMILFHSACIVFTKL